MHLGGPDFISTSLEQAQSVGSGSGSSSGSSNPSSSSNSSSGSAAASSSAGTAATRTTPTSSRGETAGEGSRSTFSVQSDGSTSRQTFQTLDHVMRAPSSLLPEVVVLDSMPEGLDRKEVLDPKEDLWLSTADGRYSSPIIPLHVGEAPYRETFHVHKHILLKSEYFEKALCGSFQESGAQAIELPEEDPSTFHFLVAYLYEGKYDPIKTVSTVLVPDQPNRKGKDIASSSSTQETWRDTSDADLLLNSDNSDDDINNDTAADTDISAVSRRRRERRRRREERHWEHMRQKHPGRHRPSCSCPQCLAASGPPCWSCHAPRAPPPPPPPPVPGAAAGLPGMGALYGHRYPQAWMMDDYLTAAERRNRHRAGAAGGAAAAGAAPARRRPGDPTTTTTTTTTSSPLTNTSSTTTTTPSQPQSQTPAQAAAGAALPGWTADGGGRIAGEDLRTWLLAYELHIDVYILANKFLLQGFKREIARVTIDMLETAGPDAAVPKVLSLCQKLYEGLPENDQLLKMIFARVGFLQPWLVASSSFTSTSASIEKDGGCHDGDGGGGGGGMSIQEFWQQHPDIAPLLLREAMSRRGDDYGGRSLPSMERPWHATTGAGAGAGGGGGGGMYADLYGAAGSPYGRYGPGMPGNYPYGIRGPHRW